MENPSYVYRKLNLEDLESNKWYIFYKNDNTKFNATFDRIIRDTLIVKNYKTDEEKRVTSLTSIPKKWIKYAESDEFK